MTKSKTQTITSTILSDTELKKIKLSINDGKDTTCYLKFTNDMEENTKKGIYISRLINSAGRKMGLEIYQTTTGCEDVIVMIQPTKDTNGDIDQLEITIGVAGLGDLVNTKCVFTDMDKHNKSILIDLIKSNIKYMTEYMGNPIGLK